MALLLVARQVPADKTQAQCKTALVAIPDVAWRSRTDVRRFELRCERGTPVIDGEIGPGAWSSS